MEKQRIPADFLIGTSSSAWQIEGCAGKKEGQESWAELFTIPIQISGMMM